MTIRRHCKHRHDDGYGSRNCMERCLTVREEVRQTRLRSYASWQAALTLPAVHKVNYFFAHLYTASVLPDVCVRVFLLGGRGNIYTHSRARALSRLGVDWCPWAAGERLDVNVPHVFIAVCGRVSSLCLPRMLCSIHIVPISNEC